MDSAHWKRVQELFHAAADLPPQEQRAFLKNACGENDGLMGEVLALLAEDAQGSSLLDHDVARVAGQFFGEEAISPLSFKDFGPYRIKYMLGEGGMGVVYLAERSDLGTLVAIKFLRDAWLSPARRERFASEQRTLAQLNHTSIARLYDADTLADGTPWFVMEYVEGVPLTQYCRENQCSIKRRLRLFRAVCEAVQYAHRQAVIHRDLKPSNILVKNDGSVRLLDFGIAKQLESLETPVDQTRTGLRLMTPAYAAPEQFRGERVGIQTDVYSLGVILYELLAGKLPFDLLNCTAAQAEKIIAEHEPEKPSAVVSRTEELQGASAAVPSASKTAWADLDVLCLAAMHKDAARRYQSVEALIRDIDHYLNGEPLDARLDTLRYRAGKFVRRNRRSVIAASAAFAIILGVVVFFAVRLAIARNAALAEAARTQRIQQFMTNLFQGGDEATGPSDSLRVVTLLDRGVQEARALDQEPEVQAELYQTLGEIYQKLGKLDQADPLMRSALDERKSLFGNDSREVAESLVALGLLRADQAKLDDAERLVRQGLEMSKRHLPPNHPDVAKATAALGKVLEDRGTYDQAIQVLDEAVRLQSTGAAVTPELASSLSELANTHFYAGHYDTSETLNQRVLAMNRQLYGDRHPLVADTLINLGAVKFELGHYQEAEVFDRQALDIDRAFYGNEHPETASALTILGRTLVAENRYSEATDLLQQALAIQERVYGKVHPRVASALNELGKVALQEGKLDDAEAYFRRMVDIEKSVYGDKHYLVATALSNLGSVYMERKEYPRAEDIFRDVVRRYTEELSPNHPNTGIARIKLGRSLLRQQRYSDAEVESRAGYEILIKQTSPSINWLQNARQDLAEEYTALNRPADTAKFKAEFALGGVPTAAAAH
ncbi:MAG: serine/threonine-protein kinase [Candidatus Acidiferrales bacterium]